MASRAGGSREGGHTHLRRATAGRRACPYTNVYLKGSAITFFSEGLRVDAVILEFPVEVLPGDADYLLGVCDVSVRLGQDLTDENLLERFAGFLKLEVGVAGRGDKVLRFAGLGRAGRSMTSPWHSAITPLKSPPPSAWMCCSCSSTARCSIAFWMRRCTASGVECLSR